MDTVTVLMSTYNGERYVKTQIDSILAQRGVSIRLIIRDDGSDDNTKEILGKYEERYDNIKIIFGENIGWRASFSELIILAENSEYYAFSDQDDYWYEDKLLAAVSELRKHKDIPCLYRGRSIVADSDLKSTGRVYNDSPLISITRSLYQNYCQGCTLVFNKKLRDLYLICPIKNVSHDVWMPLLALHIGVIIDDSTAYMLYRIHSSNASAGKTIWQTFKKRINVITKKSDSLYHYNYGEVLFDNYNHRLKPESAAICKKMKYYRGSRKDKISLFLNPEVRGNSLLRTILVKYFILTNSYRSDI